MMKYIYIFYFHFSPFIVYSFKDNEKRQEKKKSQVYCNIFFLFMYVYNASV
jgi:hypothetical protein